MSEEMRDAMVFLVLAVLVIAFTAAMVLSAAA